MPIDTHPGKGDGKVGSFLNAETAGLPNWAWLLVVAAGIAAAVFIPKIAGKGIEKKQETEEGKGLGLAIDPTTGLPYAVEGLVPSGGAGNPPLITSGTNTIPSSGIMAVKARPRISSRDIGIPIRDIPGGEGETIGQIAYNSPVDIVGPVQQGTSNFAGSSGGSTLWYPVKGGGYISAFDVNAGATGPSLSTSMWPYPEMNTHILAMQRGIGDSKMISLNPDISGDNIIYPGLRYNV